MMRPMSLLLIFSLLIACGGGDSGPTPTPEPTPTPTEVPTPTPEPPCSTEDGELVYDLLNEFSQEWSDAVDLAGSTSRIALSGPVQELQRIRRDVQSQEWPECAEDAHEALVSAMDATIDGFLAFMSQEPDSVVERYLGEAADEMDEFFDQLEEIAPDDEE